MFVRFRGTAGAAVLHAAVLWRPLDTAKDRRSGGGAEAGVFTSLYRPSAKQNGVRTLLGRYAALRECASQRVKLMPENPRELRYEPAYKAQKAKLKKLK